MDVSAAPPLASSTGRLPMLDGLRGIAAIIVLLFHFEQLQGIRGPFAHGYLAVDFFFLLSGFVLTGPFERDAAERSKRVGRVVIVRLLRFWPLMALGALIGAGEHLLRWPVGQVLPLLALSVLSIPLAWGGAGYFALNGPQWSLFVELAFNALHVALLRHLKARVLIAVSLVCGGVLAWSGRHVGSLALGTDYDDMVLGLLRAGSAYPLGVAIARRRDWLDALPTVPAWLAPAVLTGAIILPTSLGLFEQVAETLTCGLFVAALMLGARARPAAGTGGALAWLGAISFPLYAVHFPILEAADMARRAAPAIFGPVIFTTGLALSLALAHWLSRTGLSAGIRLDRVSGYRSGGDRALANGG